MARPTYATCPECGDDFAIASRGPIPELCRDCRGKPPSEQPAAADPDPPEDPDAVAVTPEDVTEDPDEAEPVTFQVSGLDDVLAAMTDAAAAEAQHIAEAVFPEYALQGVVFDGRNYTEVRETLDADVCIDVHRGNGHPMAEVHGVDRDWFCDVSPGDTVLPTGTVVSHAS